MPRVELATLIDSCLKDPAMADAESLRERIAEVALLDAYEVPVQLIVKAKSLGHYSLMAAAAKADRITCSAGTVPMDLATRIFCDWDVLPDIHAWRAIMEAGAIYVHRHRLDSPELYASYWVKSLPELAERTSRFSLHATDVMALTLNKCPVTQQAQVNDAILTSTKLTALHPSALDQAMPQILLRTPLGEPFEQLWEKLQCASEVGAVEDFLLKPKMIEGTAHAARLGKNEYLRTLVARQELTENDATNIMYHSIMSGNLETAQVAQSLSGNWELAIATATIDVKAMAEERALSVLGVLKVFAGRNALQVGNAQQHLETDLDLV